MPTPAELAVQAAIARATQSDQSHMRSVRTPFVGPGNHQLLVAETEASLSDKGEFIVWVKSVITSSDREVAPLKIAARYNLSAPARFDKSASDADMFAAFLMAVTGAPNDGRLPDGTSNENSVLGKLITDLVTTRSKDNMLRGMAYAISATYAKRENPKYALASDGRKYEVTGRDASGNPILNRDKQQYVYVAFAGVEQSDAEVAAGRAWLDERFPVEVRQAPPAAAGSAPPPPEAPPQPAGPAKFRLPS